MAPNFLSQHPKVRNVLNLDFPDSNHLAKALTIVSGPDMVNLTYHNFFAPKEKLTQVINLLNTLGISPKKPYPVKMI